MEPISFAVLGVDVVSGGNINTNSTGGTNGLGEVTFSSGQPVFEADDVVVIEVTNPTAEGEIGPGSSISDITVFEDYASYQAYLDSVAAGTPDTSLIKYNYAPQNPGQTATVQSDISGLGDSYVRFNANILIPQDGGPALTNTLTIAPGTNIGAANAGSVTIDRVRDFDLNYNTTIDSGTLEVGNSNFYIGDYVEIVNGGPVCFTAGTKILTEKGERAIETLQPGDKVFTMDNGYQPLRWIGRKKVRATGTFAPVRFAAGAIGNSAPLEVSQNHRILRRGAEPELLFGEAEVLVAAKFMVNGTTVRIREGGWVEYVHILFEEHEIVITDNVASESLFPSWQELLNGTCASQLELSSLFPASFDFDQDLHLAARPCLRTYEAALLCA